jgi:hypothetical protein
VTGKSVSTDGLGLLPLKCGDINLFISFDCDVECLRVACLWVASLIRTAEQVEYHLGMERPVQTGKTALD